MEDICSHYWVRQRPTSFSSSSTSPTDSESSPGTNAAAVAAAAAVACDEELALQVSELSVGDNRDVARALQHSFDDLIARRAPPPPPL
jgi:hypothetical protein